MPSNRRFRAGRRIGVVIALAVCGSASPVEVPSATITRPLSASQPTAVAVTAALRARLNIRAHPVLGRLTEGERMELERLYELEGHTLLWSDASWRPSRAATIAISVLDGAQEEGLDPQNYGAGRLRSLADELRSAPTATIDDLAAFDVCLSGGMLRYLRDLHLGRVDPRTLGLSLRVSPERHFVGVLRSTLANHRIVDLPTELAPPLGQYRALRAALAEYRALASAESLPSIPQSVETIRPGDRYGALHTLLRQLIALGDLPAGTAATAESQRYEGAVVDGVKRFQLRHGLKADGVLGRQTQAALRVPLPWRIRQIELALERLRWLPDLGGRRLIALNIPTYQLWTWDSLSAGAPSGSMRAIVGRAISTETPVFASELREVVFRPYWNVPRSILRHEILPLLQREPGYLAQNDMEMVRGEGDGAAPVANTPQNLALLTKGVLRLRQRPGPQNALGLVKFVFPNDGDIYMHGTPAQALFDQPRRDFSHGCVRVEDPLALAEWVLSREPGWNRERIARAMSGVTSQRITLTEPIDVVLFYTTAAVTGESRRAQFTEDVYRHDARLDRALRMEERSSR